MTHIYLHARRAGKTTAMRDATSPEMYADSSFKAYWRVTFKVLTPGKATGATGNVELDVQVSTESDARAAATRVMEKEYPTSKFELVSIRKLRTDDSTPLSRQELDQEVKRLERVLRSEQESGQPRSRIDQTKKQLERKHYSKDASYTWTVKMSKGQRPDRQEKTVTVTLQNISTEAAALEQAKKENPEWHAVSATRGASYDAAEPDPMAQMQTYRGFHINWERGRGKFKMTKGDYINYANTVAEARTEIDYELSKKATDSPKLEQQPWTKMTEQEWRAKAEAAGYKIKPSHWGFTATFEGYQSGEWTKGGVGWIAGNRTADVSISPGKTYRQLASECRRAAQSDRSGGGKKPAPGMARGEPDEFSFRSAEKLDRYADWLERRASESTGKVVTQEDITAMRAVVGDASWDRDQKEGKGPQLHKTIASAYDVGHRGTRLHVHKEKA